MTAPPSEYLLAAHAFQPFNCFEDSTIDIAHEF